MKKFIYTLFFCVSAFCSDAQILRNIKKEIEYKADRKIREKVDQGIDTLFSSSEKKKQKKEGSKHTVETQQGAIAKEEQEAPGGSEGYITLKLSTPIISKGLTVEVTGESVKYQKWNSVKVLIKGPKEEETINAALNDSGKYNLVYDKLLEEGDYVFTANSSDGKSSVSRRLLVIDYFDLRDENQQLIEITGKAFQRIKEKSEALRQYISQTDVAKLQDKVNAVKDNLDALHKALNSLSGAKAEVGNFLKRGGVPSKSLLQNMTDLNLSVMDKVEEVGKITEWGNHPPYDNTVCEYIAMLNEACAAFETFTNVWSKTVTGLIRNIMLDKVIPKAASAGVGVESPGVFKSEAVGEELTWGVKKATKIYSTALLHFEEFHHKLARVEFASAMVRFATDVLLKSHCGIFKGTLTHNFKLDCRNDEGETWWEYSVSSKAAVVLRYPKSGSGIIKMKGTIEGNATNFQFNADPGSNPEYVEGTGGRVQTMVLKNITPVSIPFTTSLSDALGFGMVARGAATPAYFLIPIDAEYNTQTNKIKIFINEALWDYLPIVCNKQIFIQLGAGLISGLKIMEYPISKARLTIKAALKEDNEFDMQKDAKGGLHFKDMVQRKIINNENGMQHDLSVSISVKKE